MYTSTNYPEEIEDESAKGWYGSIQVSVRVRPVLERQEHKRIGSRNLGPPAPDLAGEMNKNRALATSAWRSSSSMSTASPYVKWKWTPNSISHFEIDGGASVLRFPCHRVFAPTDATESVFSDVVLPLVNGMLRQGLDSCVFTYGQTNSGKTYTTFGTERQPGIVPRTAERIFSYIRDEMEPGTHALLRLSLFEVYNEVVRDLLVEGTPSLTPHDHPTAEVTLTGASEHFVTSVEDLLTRVAHGQKQRTSATNNVHEHASRSHCIVRLIFEHSDQQLSKGLTRRWSQHYANSPYGAIDVGGPNTTLASMYLVDLAGSEANYFSVSSRASEMQAVTDRKELLNIAQQAQGTLENMRKETHTRMVEGSNIRRSLLALQRCIAIRAQQYYSDTQTGGTHVPYRESKLTRILRHALCGRCATVLICTVDPTEEKETLATLRFASTAQKVHVMQQSSKEVLHSVLHEYQEEIDGLRNEMEERNTLHDQSVRQMITQANNKLNELSGKKTQVHAEEQSLQDQYEKLMRHLIQAGTSSHDHINVKRSNPSNPSRQRRRASIPMSQSELAKNQTARARQQTLYNQQHRKVIGDCTTSMSCGVIVPLLAEHLIKQWEYPIPVADFCKDGGSAIVRDGVQHSTQYTAQAQKDAEEERQQLLTILRTLDAGPMLDSLLLNSIQDDNTHGKVCPSEDISIGRDNECEKQMCEREENMRRLLQEKEDVRLEEEYLALQDLYLHVGRGNLALEEAIQRTVTFRAPGICGGSKPPLMREQDFLLPVDQFKQKHTVEFEPAPMRS